MNILTLSQIKSVSGGAYEKNLSDALDVVAILGGVAGIAGGLFEFSRVMTTSTSPLSVLSNAFGPGLAYSTFAGIGFGVVLGAISGAGLYYSGIIFKEENK